MATKTKNFGMIFPHSWQRVGFWMLAISFFCIVGNAFLEGVNSPLLNNIFGDANSRLYCSITIIPLLMHISLFIICLSSEREEDEFVMHVRVGIIKKIIFFWFIASFFELIISGLYFTFGNTDTIDLLCKIIKYFTDIYVLLIVYIVWLKVKLDKLRKEAAND